MSASISLLRSRRKAVEDCDDSGEESDCSIKDPMKKESIEKDARAIAAINMLTVSMVNQLLERQGLDPFGKSLASPSHDDDQSWGTPVRTTSRQSITRSIKENTLTKKSRKSVRFTPDTSRTEFTPERSCDAERLDLTHTRTVSMSALKMEPKFTPLRRSKALKAGLLRSLENEQDIGSVDSFACPNDSFDSPLPVRNLALNTNPCVEAMDDTPVLDVKPENSVPVVSQKEPEFSGPAPKAAPSESISVPFSEETPCEKDTEETGSKLDETQEEDAKDQNDLVCETPIKPRWTHHFDPTSPEHMSPFLKTLLEERAERGQGKEFSKSFSMLEDSEDQPRLSVLKGVVAFVEVRKADEDRSSGFRWKLKQLGAQVEENFTKKVTHVVFQEGLLSTYRKAKESNVHLVSAVWVMACDESSTRAPEDKYPIDEEDKYSMLAPLKKYIRRPKLMSPNLGDDNDEKRLARRLQAIKRRSMKIEGTSGAESDANDGAAAHASKTNPDSKTSQPPKRTSHGKKQSAASSGSSSVLMSAWLSGKKKPDAPKGVGEDAPTVAQSQTFALSTKSPRKRASEVKSTDSPAKQKATLKSPVKDKLGARSFDSPVKTKSSSRFVDSPVKTKTSSRFVDSPVKTKISSRFVDSPVTTRSTSRFVDSPVKTKSGSRFVNSPVKTKSSSRLVDSPVKTKSSSRLVDSPVKTKSSSRLVDSPVKTKSGSRFVDSPVKTKSSSRFVDSPVKTKSSSRFVDSPVKTKSSSRFVNSPVKTKLTSKPFDSPVKTKSSSRTFDSPLKTKPDIYSFDSPKRPKLSRKETDSTSSTCVASPARPKTSSRTRTPSKRDLIKESLTPEKSLSPTPTSAVTAESRERSVRSTPSKTAAQCSSSEAVPMEDTRRHEKTEVGKLGGKGSIASWLSANNSSLSSPAKRSLSGAFKGVTSNPARRSKASASSTTKGGEPVSKSVPEVDLKSPELFEAPKKKARIGPTPQKKTAEGGTQRSTSETAKQQKSTSSGPSQSKDNKKKISPRGKAAMKSKGNDKSQTVLTSHFRFVVSPKEETKVKAVTEERCGDVSEHKSVLVLSTEDDMQTSPPLNSVKTHVGNTVADTNDEIDCDMPMACPSIVESGSEGSFVPVTSDDQKESHVLLQADDISISAVVTEELRVTGEDCKEQVFVQDVSEEQPITCDSPEFVVGTKQLVTLDVGEEQASGIEKPRSTSDVLQEQPTAEDKTVADISYETSTPEALQEPRINEYVNDKQPVSADSSQEGISVLDMGNQQSISADSVEEMSVTLPVSEEQPISIDSVEERSATPLVGEEDPISIDSAEERSATPLVGEEHPIPIDSAEERSATPLLGEEHPISIESAEERSATPLVREEHPISIESAEERSATPLVGEEKPISIYSAGERSATPLLSEEHPISTDSAEERSATPLVGEEHPIPIDSAEERSATPLVREEQLISVDSAEESSATPLVREEQPISIDSAEERSATPLVREEQLISVDFAEVRSATPLVREEQPISIDSAEERSATPLVSGEQPISIDSAEERSATPLVREEQPLWANSSEERSATPLASKEQLISAVNVEEPGGNLDSVEAAKFGRPEDSRTLSNLSEEQVATDGLPDKSSGSVSRDAEGSCDSFSSISSVNSTGSGVKRGRKSIKPVDKPSHYRTRRSTRFLLTSDVTD